MKQVPIFVLFIICIGADTLSDGWNKFKRDHNKVYTSLEEDSRRYEIFQQNLELIKNHNAKYERGETTYYMGINKFTDLTKEEREEMYLTKINQLPERRESTVRLTEDVPKVWNWTEKGVVTDVKDQQTCGCCYAFAAVAAIESANAIVNKKLINLSVQQVLDCSAGDSWTGDIYLNHGCYGGIIEGSIHYVMDHGIQTDESYPYESRLGSCRAESSRKVVSVKAYENVPANETLLMAAVGTIGPVAACIDAREFFDYAGGILDGRCHSSTSHVILIVGYGTENGIDYWNIKNSWGPTWGLNGYAKVRRNHNNAFCISTYTAYPIMK